MDHPARIIPPTGEVLRREKAKIREELREKYREEPARAKGWKARWLRFKIDLEAGRIFLQRVYWQPPKRFGRILPLLFLAVLARPVQADPPALQESAPAVKSALNDVITRQLAAFHAGDFRRAYTFAALEIRSRYNPAAFEQMVKLGFPILTRSTSTEFGPTLDDGENGVVYVKVGDAQGEQLYLYSLKREDKDWKIIGVSQKDEEQADPPAPAAPNLPPDSA